MTLEKLNQMLDEAIADGAERPHAMEQTNILNASYASGKMQSILDIIHDVYGIDAFIEAVERTRGARDAFTQRAQAIY